MKFFICTYTNRVKDYCDTEFYDNLHKLSKGHPIFIVDNTIDAGEYAGRIELLTKHYANFSVNHLTVPKEPAESQFQRNVAESVNLCRDNFLRSNCDHMIIVESDVLPPHDLLDKFEESALFLEGEKWGIVGGIYYMGFHDYNLQGIVSTHHVLSGCTMYNKELIKETPFRYHPDILGAFPDAWISGDAGNKGYKLWNNHDIICEHLSNPNTGNRYSGSL